MKEAKEALVAAAEALVAASRRQPVSAADRGAQSENVLVAGQEDCEGAQSEGTEDRGDITLLLTEANLAKLDTFDHF